MMRTKEVENMEIKKKLPRIQIEVSEDFKHAILMKACEQKVTIKEVVHNLLNEWLKHDKQGS